MANAALAQANYAASLPFPTLPALPAKPTRNMSRLAAVPVVRIPRLRPGRIINNSRATNLEALLAQYVGQVEPTGCTHCQTGFGTWTKCVVAPSGMLGGSCANCHYGSEGTRCSLRPTAPAPAAGASSSGRSRRRTNTAEVAPPTRPTKRARLTSSPPATTGLVRAPRVSTKASRARRFARLFGELSVLFEEEALAADAEEEEDEVEEDDEEEDDEEEDNEGEDNERGDEFEVTGEGRKRRP